MLNSEKVASLINEYYMTRGNDQEFKNILKSIVLNDKVNLVEVTLLVNPDCYPYLSQVVVENIYQLMPTADKWFLAKLTNAFPNVYEIVENFFFESEDGDSLCMLAKASDIANISSIETKLLKLADPYYLYTFAMNQREADIERIEDFFVERGSAFWIYKFAVDSFASIAGIDLNIPRLEDAIIKRGDPHWIYYFALNVKGADIKKLENAIVEIGDFATIRSFMSDVEGANVTRLSKVIKNFKGKAEEMPSEADIVTDYDAYLRSLDELN